MLPNLLSATAPPGPHLPVALLRQYVAGTLAPAAQHRVEAHTLACPRCADVLAGLLQTPAATTDQALAQLQRRLRQRTQPVAPERLGWGPRRARRWLAPQLAAAAVLLLSLVAGGWWAWQQRHQAAVGAPVATAAEVPSAPAGPVAAPLPPAAAAASEPAAGAIAVARPRPARSGRLGQQRPAAPAGAPVLPADAARSADVAAAPSGAVGRSSGATARADSLSAPLAVTSAPAAAAAPVAASKSFSEVVVSEPAKSKEARPRAQMPEPPPLLAAPAGGLAALREYLREEAAGFIPEPAAGGPLSGTVLVRLRIGADGKIEQAEAVRKLRPDYDAEAIRLLREGPAWVPGTGRGRRVAQSVEVGVSF